MTESAKAMTMDPMASEAASLRCRCFARAMMPAATTGSAGISHRFWTIQLIRCAGQPFMEFIWSRSVFLVWR